MNSEITRALRRFARLEMYESGSQISRAQVARLPAGTASRELVKLGRSVEISSAPVGQSVALVLAPLAKSATAKLEGKCCLCAKSKRCGAIWSARQNGCFWRSLHARRQRCRN